MTRALRCGRRTRVQGFTLIEIVAALVLFALAIGVFMQMTGNSMKATRQAKAYSTAALHAQSLLDAVGHGEELEEGQDSGRFDDGYEWTLVVRKEDPRVTTRNAGIQPAATGAAPAPQGAAQPLGAAGITEEVPVDLFRLELTLRWPEGRDWREAGFTTLRAVQPSGN